eukprot:SAG31_NODE_78_length_27447_cov_83.819877_12_plen_174_part_00
MVVVGVVLQVARVQQVLVAPRERLVADAEVRVLRRRLGVGVRSQHELDEDAGDGDGEDEGVLLPVLDVLVVRGVVVAGEAAAADRPRQRGGAGAGGAGAKADGVEHGGHWLVGGERGGGVLRDGVWRRWYSEEWVRGGKAAGGFWRAGAENCYISFIIILFVYTYIHIRADKT